jgi:hypothetical protein
MADQPMRVYRTANGYLSKPRWPPAALRPLTRRVTPAFANIKTSPATSVPLEEGSRPKMTRCRPPKIEDGVRGMAFIEAVVASSGQCQWTSWVKVRSWHEHFAR